MRRHGWRRWRVALVGGGALLGLAGCGGPALTPLQAQYQREEERALRFHARGELERSLGAFQDSLRWAEMADDRPGIMAQSLNVGSVALTLGDESLAEPAFQQALRAAVALPDPAGELPAPLGPAPLRLRVDQFEAARGGFRPALGPARPQRDHAAMVVALNGLGLAEKGLGRSGEARLIFRETEVLARALGDRRLLAATLANQASLALQNGEWNQAASGLQEAIDLDRATENLPGLAHGLTLLAQVRERQGDFEGALEAYRQARIIVRHTGQRARLEEDERAIQRLERESSGRLLPGPLE